MNLQANFFMEENLEINNKLNNEISDNANKPKSDEKKEPIREQFINMNENNTNSQKISAPKIDIKNENDTPPKAIPKPQKELPVEKKPFQEFINIHLIPALIKEINQRGLEINNINLTNTNRPIAGDKLSLIHI